MPELIIVSACLAGIHCRYNGTHGKIDAIEKLVLSGIAIPLCPEVLGGLGIPRMPCEIKGSGEDRQVISKKGENLTRFFKKGAEKTLTIAKITGATKAILKSRSPSCGHGSIYDSSFSGKLIKGNGLTADLLEKNNILVLTEETFDNVFK